MPKIWRPSMALVAPGRHPGSRPGRLTPRMPKSRGVSSRSWRISAAGGHAQWSEQAVMIEGRSPLSCRSAKRYEPTATGTAEVTIPPCEGPISRGPRHDSNDRCTDARRASRRARRGRRNDYATRGEDGRPRGEVRQTGRTRRSARDGGEGAGFEPLHPGDTLAPRGNDQTVSRAAAGQTRRMPRRPRPDRRRRGASLHRRGSSCAISANCWPQRCRRRAWRPTC